ncbi:cardiolipin synthase [Xylophilus sp. Kf1]|nr:cardiolipin synthase [Xylophilus sp. Kf1]
MKNNKVHAWRDRLTTDSRRSGSIPWKAVVVSVLLTVVATLLVLNFSPGEKRLDQQLPRLYGTSDPQFERTMGVLLGPPVLTGNQYRALINGDAIFPAMLDAIRGAQTSITFETYIYWSGDIGRQFAEALSERARAGVKVHVLLDWVGSQKIEQSYLNEMERAGVHMKKFHPVAWYSLGRLNNRTHRKLLVIDGQTGFTGGVGIAPTWTGQAQDPDHWRDSHYQVQGPVVAQMQAVFVDNWTKTSGEVLHGARYFPPIATRTTGETGKAQMFSSSPSGGSESMHLMYLAAITAAERSIDLSSAYFVPDDLTIKALLDARRRGVRIRVIVPGPVMDSQTVKAASRAMWGRLMAAGIEIWEYQPTMYHCKVLILDNLLVSVGSTNFDDRSFRLNDEANLNIYDAAFAAAQTATFEEDIKRSNAVTMQAWENRPLKERLAEKLASVISTQL